MKATWTTSSTKGYSAGYGLPEWQWNAEITKSIGAFNLSLSVHDILNQTRNLTHTVTANYEEDTYRLVMGRYVLFGVKWNFGKMNAGHSARAQQAALEHGLLGGRSKSRKYFVSSHQMMRR